MKKEFRELLHKYMAPKSTPEPEQWRVEAGRKGGSARVPKGFSNPEVRAKAYATREANKRRKH